MTEDPSQKLRSSKPESPDAKPLKPVANSKISESKISYSSISLSKAGRSKQANPGPVSLNDAIDPKTGMPKLAGKLIAEKSESESGATPTRRTHKPIVNNVPKQTQISPQLEAQLRKRGKAKRRFQIFASAIRRIGVVLLALGLPAAVIQYSYFMKLDALEDVDSNAEITVDSKTIASKKTFRTLLETGTVSELVNFAGEHDKDVLTDELHLKLLTFQQKKQIAERILELKPNQETTSFAAKQKIAAIVSLAALNLKYNLGLPEYSQQLEAFATENLSTSNSQTVSHARFGLLNVRIHEFIADGSQQNFESVKDSVEILFRDLSPDIQQHFFVVFSLLGLSNEKELALDLRQLVITKLVASGNEAQRKLGLELLDYSVTGEARFDSLREELPSGSRAAISELKAIVASIEREPDVSSATYQNVLSLVDSLHDLDDLKLASELAKTIKSSAARVRDPLTKEKTLKTLNEIQTRSDLPGKQFLYDVAGSLDDANEPVHAATVIVFIDTINQESIDWLGLLQEFLNNERLGCLIVFTNDEPISPEVKQSIEMALPIGQIVSHPQNQPYIEQCPVTWSPLMVLVDRSQQVHSLQYSLHKLKKSVAEVLENGT